MASVIWDQAQGISYRDDPATGAATYTLTAFVQDLAPGSTASLIAQAVSLMPAVGSPGPIGNTVVYSRNPEASPPFDAIVKINYGPPIAGSLFGPVKVRIGTTACQDQTAFDWDNQQKPLLERTPIVVKYDPGKDGAPGAIRTDADPAAQGGQVPFYAGKSVAVFSLTLRENPGPLSRQYTCKTNSTDWKGEAPGTVICLGIEGVSTDGEITFGVDITVAYDALNLWRPALRWVDPLIGEPPKLTKKQVKGENGIIFPIVQGEEDFNNLPI